MSFIRALARTVTLPDGGLVNPRQLTACSTHITEDVQCDQKILPSVCLEGCNRPFLVVNLEWKLE